jgi:Effector-associated domain 2/Effector-associated domain 1
MPDELIEAIVEILDREPLFTEPASRSLLARLTGNQLGFAPQIPQVPYRRQWLLAFVMECAAAADGLAALTSAVGRMDGRGRVYRALDLLVRGASGPAAATPVTVVPQPASPPFAEAEITALGEAYSEPAAARRLLARAGLPYGRHPRAERNGEAFWTEVNRLLVDGAFPDGRTRILREAARDYPASRWFAVG